MLYLISRQTDKPDFGEVSIMRTIISIVIIIVAAAIGAFFGSGMNQSMGGAILCATIAGFACTIQAIENKKKQ